MHFDEATPVQEKAIPAIMQGRDLLATAQTGTGKTASFVLPILNNLAINPSEKINTLIIVPTRELALQIEQAIQGFSYYINASSIAVYGGGDGIDFNLQRNALRNGVNIVVATPGKMISHLNQGYVDASALQFLILDEADRMLDMGFYDDIQKIISFLPEKRQNLMFSATMPTQIMKLVKQTLKNHIEIKIAVSKPAEGVSLTAYHVFDTQKIPLAKDIIQNNSHFTSILIFTSTKKNVLDLVRALKNNKYTVAGISSDFDQKERENVLLGFKSGNIKVLVATDVLSRGIDIANIDMVINYDVPSDAEDYVHRVGRTARAASKGEAVTFVNKDDAYKMIRIERLIERKIEVMPLPIILGKGPEFNNNGANSNENHKNNKGFKRGNYRKGQGQRR